MSEDAPVYTVDADAEEFTEERQPRPLQGTRRQPCQHPGGHDPADLIMHLTAEEYTRVISELVGYRAFVRSYAAGLERVGTRAAEIAAEDEARIGALIADLEEWQDARTVLCFGPRS